MLDLAPLLLHSCVCSIRQRVLQEKQICKNSYFKSEIKLKKLRDRALCFRFILLENRLISQIICNINFLVQLHGIVLYTHKLHSTTLTPKLVFFFINYFIFFYSFFLVLIVIGCIKFWKTSFGFAVAPLNLLKILISKVQLFLIGEWLYVVFDLFHLILRKSSTVLILPP